MFAIRCPYPYCQHENKPGARFCADCGAPLHLKPCAKCGKVDDVTAKACSTCNTAFPPIKLAEYSSGDPAATPPPTEFHQQGKPEFSVEKPKPDQKAQMTSAVPLVVIALFAGGVPLLWMNRGNLPSHGGSGSESGIAPVFTPQKPAVQTLPAPVAPPQTLPASASDLPAATETPASLPQIQTRPDLAEAQNTKVAIRPKISSETKGNKQTSKADMGPDRKTGASLAPTSAPTRPCTDAVAALGLCNQGTK